MARVRGRSLEEIVAQYREPRNQGFWAYELSDGIVGAAPHPPKDHPYWERQRLFVVPWPPEAQLAQQQPQPPQQPQQPREQEPSFCVEDVLMDVGHRDDRQAISLHTPQPCDALMSGRWLGSLQCVSVSHIELWLQDIATAHSRTLVIVAVAVLELRVRRTHHD